MFLFSNMQISFFRLIFFSDLPFNEFTHSAKISGSYYVPITMLILRDSE